MGDGFTGIKIEQVIADLDSFRHSMKVVIDLYTNAFDEFNYILEASWASNKAAEFCRVYLRPLAEVEYDLTSLANDILTSGAQAAQDMAKANGSFFTYGAPGLTTEAHINNLSTEKDGITGMNIPVVNAAVDDFGKECKKVQNELNNLPMQFALLDPAGELLSAYQKRIKNIVDKITLALFAAKTAMESCYKTEKENVELGKSQAESELAE